MNKWDISRRFLKYGFRFQVSLLSQSVALIVLLTGCLPLYQFSVAPPAFNGLDTALKETGSDGTLRVMIVHGMGNHLPGYSSTLMSALGSRLKLKLDSKSVQSYPLINNGVAFGTNTTGTYSGNGHKLKFYEVTWTPITEPVKERQFRYDNSFAPQRQIVNGALKSGLLDTSLADAVLYVGKYRTNMQYPIVEGVKMIVNDLDASKDRIAIITFSLGSYMTTDTLRSLKNKEYLAGFGLRPEDVHQFAAQCDGFYMLADQLPLLELSDLSEPGTTIRMKNMAAAAVQPDAASGEKVQAAVQHESPMQSFIDDHDQAKGIEAMNAQPHPRLQVVAFSDPNDLLSYALQKENYRGKDVNIVNVDLIIAKSSYLGIVSNPLQAHSGWDKDCFALDLLAFGKH
jgi:hypothetical protein